MTVTKRLSRGLPHHGDAVAPRRPVATPSLRSRRPRPGAALPIRWARPLLAAAALLAGSVLTSGGCASRAELIALREGMDRGTDTIRRQHLAWAQQLSQGRQTELPTLSAAEYRAVLTAHREYQDLVAASRAQDAATPAANIGR